MATVGGRHGQVGDSVPQVMYVRMVHWFQLCLGKWSQALFGLLVAGIFLLWYISKAHLKSHRRDSESM